MQEIHPTRKNTRARQIARNLAAAALLLLGSCTANRPVATPTPAPRPNAGPVIGSGPRPQPPVAAPLRSEWRDVPATPGDWRWGMEGGKSVARFADGQLMLACDRAAATVTLIRLGTAASPASVPMTVLTTSLTRPLSATPLAGPPAGVAVAMQARDPLLDAMAFSRGRFAVEVAGLPTLYVPAWAEVGRVIEDCR